MTVHLHVSVCICLITHLRVKGSMRESCHTLVLEYNDSSVGLLDYYYVGFVTSLAGMTHIVTITLWRLVVFLQAQCAINPRCTQADLFQAFLMVFHYIWSVLQPKDICMLITSRRAMHIVYCGLVQLYIYYLHVFLYDMVWTSLSPDLLSHFLFCFFEKDLHLHFTFRSLSSHLYPKWLTISTLIRR